jgi:single-stranded-DNA-specific exonuclease
LAEIDIHWDFIRSDPDLIRQVEQEFNVPEIFARVLTSRGIVNREIGTIFFKPDPVQLHDPFLMTDMEAAVERVLAQIKAEQSILVFGDYDVDGTTGASMLYLFLKSIGAKVSTYIPSRETEGYGLSTAGIDYATLIGADLMITCDCGISAVNEVAYAAGKGIDVIITDHHMPDTMLPQAKAILNPKRIDCNYPFSGLCGGGVAFKLALAVAEKGGYDPGLVWEHSDLIALGTAADMVPILDENRVLVHHGIERIQERSRPGLAALWQVAGLSGKEVTVGRLVFGVAPKINAAGRLGDAGRAVKLLTTRNRYLAVSMARELMEENTRRQAIQESTVEDAIFQVHARHDLSTENALVLHSENWHQGVIGIVAARIRDMFHRPTVIIAMDNSVGRGSARSMPGFDLYDALARCKDHLVGFGGHAAAAGLSINEEHLSGFADCFLGWANDTLTEEQLQPRLTVEGECSLSLIESRFLRFLRSLAPFGPGNRRPVFVSRGVKPAGMPRLVGENYNHLKCSIGQNGITLDAIGFDMADHFEKLLLNKPLDIAYVVEENEWQGNRTIQLQLKDIKMGEES